MNRIVLLFALLLTAPACGLEPVQFWVGEGAKEASLVIDWHEAPGEGVTLSWGYRWDGAATGRDLLSAVVHADERLFAKLNRSPETASLMYGLGYDADGDGLFALDSFEPFDAHGFARGFADDYSQAIGGIDLWAEGFADIGYWHYTNRSMDGSWVSSGSGFANRTLTDGDSDGWVYTFLDHPDGSPRDYELLDDWFPDTPTPAPPPRLPGDHNADGLIDAADYTVWRDTQGHAVAVAGAGADADFSFRIHAADDALWRDAYGQTASPSFAVPEPASIHTLIAITLLRISRLTTKRAS